MSKSRQNLPATVTDLVTIEVSLPVAIVETLQKTAERRGVGISDFIRLGLVSLSRRSKYMDLETPFSFGKYQGELCITVIKCDPAYVHWCLKNIEGFILSDPAEGVLLELLHQEKIDADPKISRFGGAHALALEVASNE
jgi:hypothetical protein